MTRRLDLKSILIVGSGPIVIGQACEFDYSGTQAWKALRRAGYRVVLVNSNPATIMTDPEMADVSAASAIDHLLTWGGMPALLARADDDRRKWLQSYDTSYLERDLGDLVRLADLMPFRQFHRLCALRTGQLLNYSDLARDAGLGVSTARRYVEYLRL